MFALPVGGGLPSESVRGVGKISCQETEENFTRTTSLFSGIEARYSYFVGTEGSERLWGGLYVFPQFENEASFKRFISDKNLQISRHLHAFRHTFSHFHLDITPVLVELDEQKKEENRPLGVAENEGNSRYFVSSKANYWYDLTQPNEIGLATPVKRILDELSQENKD